VALPRVALRTVSRAVSLLVALVCRVITAGQAYYPVGVLSALIAAEAVVLERRPGCSAMTAVVCRLTSGRMWLYSPASLAILRSLPRSVGVGRRREQQLEMVGWLVRWAWSPRIPEPPLLHSAQPQVILIRKLWRGGAIDRYRAAFGMQEAYSGLNAFGLWGRPPFLCRPSGPWCGKTSARRRTCRVSNLRRVGGPVPNE